MPKSNLIKLEKVIIGLGSNVGDKIKYLSEARRLINEGIGRIVRSSSLYETEPWGNGDQDTFVNQVLEVETDKSPWQLLKITSKIEHKLFKNTSVHWGPRTIDIDILLYGQKIIFESTLIIPHPFMHLRNFVLVPFNEIGADFEHPILKKKISELLTSCNDKTKVKQLPVDQVQSEKGK